MSVIIEESNVSMEVFGSTFPKVKFNASIVVTELLAKTLENCAKELASRCIQECASRHGFDASEEIRVLGLENLALIRKQMAKKSVTVKAPKAVKVKAKKSAFPLPFIPSAVDLTKCNGLAYNRGLFTQCSKEQMDNSCFCKGCQAECDASATGIPMCGTVQQRLASGLYEFKDPKGRSPISYLKMLEKAKLLPEQAIEEAGKLSIVINEEHFVSHREEKKTKKSAKGRPKKPVGAIEAEDVTDLFAKLTAASEEEDVPEIDDDVKLSKSKKSKLTDEEKGAKKEALEAERAAKKLERDAKLAAEKEEREAKRKAEAEQKKAEREAKIAAEKAEREAKIAAEKAEREAKRLQEKEKKAAKKTEKASKVKKTDAKAAPTAAPATAAPATAAPATAAPATAAPAPSKVSVTRIQIEGKDYLKSSTNILYNPETKEEVGLWDPETKTIKDLPADSDEEEEEDEYEDEDEN